MKNVASLVLSALCAGCIAIPTPYKTYDGPPLPPSAQALIFGPLGPPGMWGVPINGALIACLDGVSLQSMLGYGPGLAHPDKVFVTPGRHYLKAMYYRDRAYAHSSMWLDAQAGREYAIRSEVKGYSVRMWLEDTTTKEVVGGIPGGEPNPAPRPMQC
ncbi:hypothetical protein [Piscinibacter gummiphilus]|uniref:Lipoprotein n=1 Tax=Piscinibacter gummiphilus TaxID=946333 RepID=A0ABZ0CPN7_9BURK|nr:hypothetical protein [Piscinibacter gummiphilus]WOB06946.1 hypothetical protein RXV79_18710 [Piscinibacter gummiphilus]